MCVIFHFTPGSSLNKQQFFNAVHNNWHGYGLVLVDANNQLQLLKGFSEEGTDPEVLWKLIEDNNDIDRYLHIRHSTKGASDETNVQPFSVYSTDSRQVFFMHNGTLHSFGGSYQNTVGKSDTLDFCEKILQPSLARWVGPNGQGDYTEEVFIQLVVDKQWTSGSTGMFVSNDLPPKRIGSGWSEYKHPDDTSSGVVWVSNTTYFEKVSRGPMFQRLEAERKANEEAKKTEEKAKNQGVVNDPFWETEDELQAAWAGWMPSNSGTGHQSGTNYGSSIKKWEDSNAAKSPTIIKAMKEITNNWDLEDPANIVKLQGVAYEEWIDIIDENGAEWFSAAMIGHLIDHFSKAYIHNAFLNNKLKKAEARIRALRKEDADQAAA